MPKPDVRAEHVAASLPQRPTAPQRALLSVPASPARSPTRAPLLNWAEFLRRTFALDVLACTRCGARRHVEAVIINSDTARAILLAKGLSAEAPPTGPPPWRRQLALSL